MQSELNKNWTSEGRVGSCLIEDCVICWRYGETILFIYLHTVVHGPCLPSFFANKALLEDNYTHLFVCYLGLFSYYNSRVEQLWCNL